MGEIEAGSVVKLRSGGQEMTVSGVAEVDGKLQAGVHYFDLAGVLHQDMVFVITLIKTSRAGV